VSDGEQGRSVPVLRRTFEACPHSVSEVRRAAVGFAAEQGADETVQQNVALAVSEAASNVVVHAYRDDRGEQGDIELECRSAGADVTIWIRDAGSGMAPRPDSPGLGLGMPLIANLADNLEIRTLDSGGTEVTMRFGVRQTCGA
jgi:serine/threonine-protein kinase RsbW